MQIKFLTIYGSPIHGSSATDAQYELLGFWQRSVGYDQVKTIKKATVEFNDYSFEEYDDQEKLCNEIKKSICSGYNHLHNTRYWQWAGKYYYVFKDLYNDLAKTHRLMELVITPENDE